MKKIKKSISPKKFSNGITLIALVITIILLLILAGISFATLTGENGILTKTTTAKETTIKAQYEEELNMTITSIRTDMLSNNKNLNMQSIIENLPKYLDSEGKTDYIWDTTQKLEEPEGEYKNYVFYIDKNYVAHIDKLIEGIKPQISSELLTTEYISEGNTVEIKIVATITEGIVEILSQNNLEPSTRQIDTNQEKEYHYTIHENGTYTFIAKGDNNRKSITTIKVTNILSKPIININTEEQASELQVSVNWPVDDIDELVKETSTDGTNFTTYHGPFILKNNGTIYARIRNKNSGEIICIEERKIENILYEWEVWSYVESIKYVPKRESTTLYCNGAIQTTVYSSYQETATGYTVSGSSDVGYNSPFFMKGKYRSYGSGVITVTGTLATSLYTYPATKLYKEKQITYEKDIQYPNVQSNDIETYPIDGIQGNYWYILKNK